MKQRKRTAAPSLSLVCLLGASLGACGDSPGEQAVQRDVYTGPKAMEQCVADWGNAELCNRRLTAEEAKQIAAQQRSSGGGSNPIFLYSGGYGYMGPSYSGERAVTHNGQRYVPSYSRARQVAAFNARPTPGAKPMGFSKPMPSGVSRVSSGVARTATGPITRGGFGSVARGGGFGGGS